MIAIATEEAVKVFKSQTCGPVIKRPAGTELPGGSVVILAKPGGVVAVLAENFGDGAAALGKDAVVAGITKTTLHIMPVSALCGLRPVIRAARVGEQSAVVWKRLYFTPLSATLSMFGVGTGPPKLPAAPKPTSSVMISRILGASLAAASGCGKSEMESAVVKPMLPAKGVSGRGRMKAGC